MSKKTLAIIKPDAVKRNIVGNIIKIIEENNFIIEKIQSYQLTKEQAEKFYFIHKAEPFFKALIDYMTSDQIIILLLRKENAVSEFRKLIGKTNPNDADDGTIRKIYAINQTENSIHGSDSDDNANLEINFFFK